MPPVPLHPRETIIRARTLYREGMRVRDICAETGMSIGTLYYHLDGLSLPGPVAPRVPRQREVVGDVVTGVPSRRRRKLIARLWRAAELQARKLEYQLQWSYQDKPRRVEDIQALRDLTRILRELSVAETETNREAARAQGGAVEHTAALAVEGRAVYVSRTKTG